MNQNRLAVVGAGVAGLAAAQSALSVSDIVVFDKGRGVGGRASSRRAKPFEFDHGAQYFTVRDPAFRSFVAACREEGVVSLWDGRVVSLCDGSMLPTGTETERYVGVPAMSALAKRLAQGISVKSRLRVAAIVRCEDRWRLTDAAGGLLGEFDQLIVTVPPSQAAELIGSSSPLGRRAAELRMRPCLAVLLGLEAKYEVPFDGAFCGGSCLSWVARNSSKPGRRGGEAWVLHAEADWTDAHLASGDDRSPDRAMRILVDELERLTGVPLPGTVHRETHLWRYAMPAESLQLGSLVDAQNGIALAGDAYVGGRIEGAYLSGVDAAMQLVRPRS